MTTAAAAVYRLALALWVGGMAVFTFVMTPVVFRAYGRDAAGAIVGTMMPVYFRYGIAMLAVALLARFLSGQAAPGARRLLGSALLASALALSAAHAFVLLPRIEAVKRTVPSFDTTPKEHPARKEFSRLHGISMALNLLLLAEGAVLVAGSDWFRE